MGLPAEKPRRATYADLEAVPPHRVAEILNGVLHVFPRPAPRHASAASAIGGELFGPFQRGRGGPGGWRILDEPELHFGPADDQDVLVPDLAGWRLERMPVLPRTAYFALAPDWVCEVLSPSTEKVDRLEKMPIYAREGVQHAWLVQPRSRILEVFRRTPDSLWLLVATHADNAVVRAEPFQEVDFDLSALWADVEGSPSAEEEEEEELQPEANVLKLRIVQPRPRSLGRGTRTVEKKATKPKPRKR
jgi:Uma2 family endonuclease